MWTLSRLNVEAMKVDLVEKIDKFGVGMFEGFGYVNCLSS